MLNNYVCNIKHLWYSSPVSINLCSLWLHYKDWLPIKDMRFAQETWAHSRWNNRSERWSCVCWCVFVFVCVRVRKKSKRGGKGRSDYCRFTLRRKSRLTLGNQTSCTLPCLHLSLPSASVHSHQSLTSRCHHTGEKEVEIVKSHVSVSPGERSNKTWNTHTHTLNSLTCKHMPQTYIKGPAYLHIPGLQPPCHSGTSSNPTELLQPPKDENVSYKPSV